MFKMALNFFMQIFLQIKMTKSKILNCIFPQTCLICGKSNNSCLCENCQKRMEKQKRVNIKKIKYENLKQYKNHFELLYIFKYKNLIRKLLLQYKFGKKAYLSNIFINIILKDENCCRKLKFYDIIIPVPMYYKKQKQRGYNQTELIANKLAESLGITLENNCLIKIKNTKVQSTQTKNDRKENIKNAFLVNNIEKLKDKNLIVFDDIYTTGSTAKEIARVLKNARCK